MKEKLQLSVIRTDGGTQARKSLDQSVVSHYAELMKEGSVFPLVTVFHDGSEYWLADGFHRYFAHKYNGQLEIECLIKQGTVRDAQLFAFAANNDHGLSMTSEDIKEVVYRILKDEEWGKWNDEKIASIIKVSRMTVFRMRKKLQLEGKVAPKKTTKYVTKHGTEAEMVLKQKPAQEAENTIVQPPSPPVEDDIVLELTNTIDEISKENEILKEKIAVGQWDASEIEKIDVQDMLNDLREKNRLLELENKTLRESRDTYQYENAQLIKTVKSLKAKLKKAGLE